MRKLGNERSALIETLHTLQQVFGYLDKPGLTYVAAVLKIPLSQVYGAATFYHHFTMKPQGEHTCIVCTGTACYIKGATALLKSIEATEGIRPGETTADGRFSLLTARCFGACGLAPVRGGSTRCNRARYAGDITQETGRGPRYMLAEELKSIAVHEREARAESGGVNVCAAASCQALASEALKKALSGSGRGGGIRSRKLHGPPGRLPGTMRGGTFSERGTRRHPLSTRAAIGCRRDRRCSGWAAGGASAPGFRLPFFRASIDRARKLRPHRSGAHGGLHRARRLSGAEHGAERDARQPRWSPKSTRADCAGAAARAIRPA